MAHSSAKSRLFTTLSHPTRSRTSSPNMDEYATAASNGSFDINNDQILHSTVNMDGMNNNTQQPLPLNYDEHPSYQYAESENSSESMSIELGRGVKRDARARENEGDVSSNIVFNFGGDSQYEITATPPITSKARGSARKSEGGLRRDASIRNASASAKRTVSGTKQRSLSETLAKLDATEEMGEDYGQHTATFNSRNTRFTRSRQVSAQEHPAPSRFIAPSHSGTPRRAATTGNPTVQSATYTANSFALPDLPNITELVSGVRKDGTPTFSRAAKPRSRFMPAMTKPSSTQHAPLESVPVPEEEKAIYASLQLLKDKVAELEASNAEAQKRAEEYETQILDLRSRLDVERRRPDSALGSDDDAAQEAQTKRLQANVRSLQERLDRSERRIAVSEIAVKRVTKERDELVTQIGVAYFNNEELKSENEMLKEQPARFDEVESECEKLRVQNELLENANDALKELLESNSRQQRVETSKKRQQPRPNNEERSPEREAPAVRSKKSTKRSQSFDRDARRRSEGPAELQDEEDIGTKINREVEKNRREAMAARVNEREAARLHRSSSARGASKSHQRPTSAYTGAEVHSGSPKRAVSAPLETEVSDVESTTGEEMTEATRNTLKSMRIPSPAKSKSQAKVLEDDERDITMISADDPLDMAKMRRTIEEQYRADKLKARTTSAPELGELDQTGRSAAGGMPRKSSLKDFAAGFENGTGRFSLNGDVFEQAAKGGKTVRVQSPHSSVDASLAGPGQENEAGDTSILSNTSRRRRARAASAEGMTSAFILPDITLHGNQIPASASSKCCVTHNSTFCTVCRPKDDITIPTPVPVTSRPTPEDPDVTTATIRPSQPPPLALATVIKNMDDEVKHLKLKLYELQQRYHQHDPALSKRQRIITKVQIERLTAEIEKRSDQIYALYDVLEGQKQAAAAAEKRGEKVEEDDVEETLMSIGIDPAEVSGRVGRGVGGGFGLDGAADDVSEGESAELPWEGLSDYESEEEVETGQGKRGGENRRSAAF